MAATSSKQRRKRVAKQTARYLSDAAANPWVERLERFGYLIRGLVYATIGVLALQLALGAGGTTANPSGAIAMLGTPPFGKVLLILIIVGLASYSLWGFIRAIFNPLQRRTDPQGLVERIGYAFSGLSYGLLILPTLQLLTDQRRAEPAGNTADLSVQLFSQPFGMGLVVGFGLLWIALGLVQLYTAYKGDAMKDFQINKMSPAERMWATRLGQSGLTARGIVFAIIGALILQAGLTHNPSQAQGFDSALLKLAQAPYGTLLLGAVALGLVAFGLYSAFSARWIKVSAA